MAYADWDNWSRVGWMVGNPQGQGSALNLETLGLFSPLLRRQLAQDDPAELDLRESSPVLILFSTSDLLKDLFIDQAGNEGEGAF
jgi:hypothetical protein